MTNTVTMKKFQILWELLKFDRDTKWTNAVGKMAGIDLLYAGLLQTFNLGKRNSAHEAQ